MKRLVLIALLAGAAHTPVACLAADRFATPIIVGDSWSNDLGDWPNFTATVMWSEYKHHAISGAWLSAQDPRNRAGMEANIVDYLEQHPEADSIIIQGGINDIVSYIDAETLKSALESILADVKAHKNIADIIVMSPGPFGNMPGWTQDRQNELEAYLDWLPGFCLEQAINCYNTYAAVGHIVNPALISDGTDGTLDYDQDGLHVNTAGAVRIAGDMDKLIESIRRSPLQVTVDIDPWNNANEVLPASNNMIPLAVLGSNMAADDASNFDVMQVDPASLRFGPGEAENAAIPWVHDFDLDSTSDALFGFRTQESGIFCGDTEVTLVGETYAGDVFVGSATISTADCVSEGCHTY